MTIILLASIIASQYSPGMMDLVVANRQSGNAWVHLPDDLPVVDGYIAVLNCDQLGETLWIKPDGMNVWEKHLIVDCSRPPRTDGTYEWMEDNNIGIEVSYETAVRWGAVGRGIKVHIGFALGECENER